jgi:hypothetical protein
MSEEPNIREELKKMPVEPLLPIEKKLIAWSLGLGVVLLLLLILISRTYFPAGG